jgi:transcriptional regulator with XRE-family HTH domain
METHYLIRKEQMMQFAKNLRELRAKENITQEVLAEKIGVSRQMVARYESGENYPEMDKAIEIAKVLHCGLDDLVNGKDFAKRFSPLPTQNISLKVEKEKMAKKDKRVYVILCCVITLMAYIATELISRQIDNGYGLLRIGLPFLIISWIAIYMYFRAK